MAVLGPCQGGTEGVMQNWGCLGRRAPRVWGVRFMLLIREFGNG